MKIIFQLRFHTRVGQSLFLTGNHELLGNGSLENAVPLRYLNSEMWETTLEWPADKISAAPLNYSYLLKNADGSVVQDWGNSRAVHLASFPGQQLLLVDSWNDAGAVENVFYTEPYKSVLLPGHPAAKPAPAKSAATHWFKVKAPLLAAHETPCLVGDCAELGHWNAITPRLLAKAAGEDFFIAPVDLSQATFPIHYKYGVYDLKLEKFVRYENGDNRFLADEPAAHKQTVVDDGFIRLPADHWKGAGVAIPVFSLRSAQGLGVGEFLDLKALVDWCRKVGLKLIQILPINDTNATDTWRDSYPYAAISAFALHPIYLNLDALLKPADKKLRKLLETERQRLNALEAVDYELVLRAKMKWLRQIFPAQKTDAFAAAAYKNFFGQNQHWLEPYAAFCALRDQFGTSDFKTWPSQTVYQPAAVRRLLETDPAFQAAVELNYFIQYQLHLQLREAAEYAHAQGVIIKGDIAIGVHRHGADVWQQPELFFTNLQAGAPPDPFDARGQNWGFPTYNWPRMRQDGFLWWQQRFAQMSHYFDAFRIDHILGFFRIWSSPAHAVEGILGIFVPAIPVKLAEFSERGIPFDRERYVKPFINDEILAGLFGAESDAVKKKFLSLDARQQWVLKPAFATQAQVEEHFAKLEPTVANQNLKRALFDLISNVILFEAAGSPAGEFHFRFGIEETTSFKQLDFSTQSKLKELYVDYFFRRQEVLWRGEGMQKLPALKRVTNMLICGEDLGMVPACVPEVMKQLGLLSLEIQRMPKTLNADFSRPAQAPYLSVVTPSTHDMSTIRGWWAEDAALTQKFFNQELGLPGQAPRQCSGEINRLVVEQHLASPAIWSIFQWQDLLGMDEKLRRAEVAAERINLPANTKNYWRYRMHLTLDELLNAGAFNESLLSLVTQWRK